MKKLLNIIVLLLLPQAILATGQEGDILIWNNDTLRIFSNPLESRDDVDSLRRKLFPLEQINDYSTSCHRRYIAEWTMFGNELYLTNIYSCMDSEVKADLQAAFGLECVDGKVKATWVSGSMFIPQGELIHYIHTGYESIYETELILIFEKGIFISQKEYDNSKSYRSVYTWDHDSLNNFIYSNIDWSKIPDLKNEKIRVMVMVQSGENRKADSVKIVTRKVVPHEILKTEALRVIKLLPEWDVYYRHGEIYPVKWAIPVVFDEETRKRYAR